VRALGRFLALGLACLLLALGPPRAVAQAAGCVQDTVVADVDGGGRVSVGDVVLSPPSLVGKVGGGSPLLNDALLAMPGGFGILDRDGTGRAAAPNAAVWDVPRSGRSFGDVLLGVVAGNDSAPFGTALRNGQPFPAGIVGAYPGTPALRVLDLDGDGRIGPGDELLGAQGSTAAAGDVRLWSPDGPPGTFVRGTDAEAGKALLPGPAMSFVDEDGSGGYDAPSCPASAETRSSSTTSSPATTSASTSTGGPSSTAIVDPCSAFGSCGKPKGSPLGAAVALSALAAALVAVRRRLG